MLRALWFLGIALWATNAAAHEHSEVRIFVIRSQLAQAGAEPILFVGDSITESALLPSSVCGHPVVNAGVGGMTASSYLPIAKSLLPSAAAAVAVIALGTNDSSEMPSQGRPTIEPGYTQLLDFVRQHAAKVIVAGIPPFDMAGELAQGYFDPALGDLNDAAIRKIAAANNLAFVDLRNDLRGENLTTDGIHLNAAGYRLWNKAVIQGIETKIRCSK